MFKFFMEQFLQVFLPKSQQKITVAAGTDSLPIDVSGAHAISFSATEEVTYTLADTYSTESCFLAQERTIGIRRGVSAITFHADTNTDIYIELM